jgi:mevalonate kinase
MPAFSASAPGKIILFGEHAVVYHRPAIAVPVEQVSAKAIVSADLRGVAGSVKIQAPDIGLAAQLADIPDSHPLAAVIRNTANALGVNRIPACTIKITSSIPVSAGMGSGAAVSVAIIRAFSAYLGHPLSNEQVSQLAFEVEKIHHGNPSGVDNTVITYGMPVYFLKDKPIEHLHARRPFVLVIADTGIQSPTATTVSDVCKAWQQHKDKFEALFDSTGAIVDSARSAIESGMTELLGPLMDANHGLLRKMGVSCPELDTLVQVARAAGALGAKLSGGGQGGNMIALVTEKISEKVADALEKGGAVRTMITQVRDRG